MPDLDRFERTVAAPWRKVYRVASEQAEPEAIARTVASAISKTLSNGGQLIGAPEIFDCLIGELSDYNSPGLWNVTEESGLYGAGHLSPVLDEILLKHGFPESGKLLKSTAQAVFEQFRGKPIREGEVYAAFSRNAFERFIRHHLLDRSPEILADTLTGKGSSVKLFEDRLLRDAYNELRPQWENALGKHRPKQIRLRSQRTAAPVNSLEYLNQEISLAR